MFDVIAPDGRQSAFAIRFAGRVHAYLNRCRHQPAEMDWQPGQFFDAQGRYLICSLHGATYEPSNGLCVAGPCTGARLIPLLVQEHEIPAEQGGRRGVFWSTDPLYQPADPVPTAPPLPRKMANE